MVFVCQNTCSIHGAFAYYQNLGHIKTLQNYKMSMICITTLFTTFVNTMYTAIHDHDLYKIEILLSLLQPRGRIAEYMRLKRQKYRHNYTVRNDKDRQVTSYIIQI